MNREGFHIGRDKTARLMKLAGVSGRRRGRTPVTTISPKVPDHRPDLVQRNFRATAPGRLWVADITYVRTLSGFAYTAFVIDVYSRKIVGVATRSTMRTDALPMEALEHALTTAGRIHGDQLIHHSDANWVWFLLLLRNDWHNAQNASPLPPVAPNPKVMERSIPWCVI